MPPLIPNHPQVTVRPIRATDKDALLDLFARLSARSRLRRFLAPKPSLSAKEVAYLTEIDGRTHAALVALGPDGAFVGVARYACAVGETETADVAFAVADAWQGRGIGTALGAQLVDHARGTASRGCRRRRCPRTARRASSWAGWASRCARSPTACSRSAWTWRRSATRPGAARRNGGSGRLSPAQPRRAREPQRAAPGLGIGVVLGHADIAAARGEDAVDETGRQGAHDLGVIGETAEHGQPVIRTVSPSTSAWNPSRSSASGTWLATS